MVRGRNCHLICGKELHCTNAYHRAGENQRSSSSLLSAVSKPKVLFFFFFSFIPNATSTLLPYDTHILKNETSKKVSSGTHDDKRMEGEKYTEKYVDNETKASCLWMMARSKRKKPNEDILNFKGSSMRVIWFSFTLSLIILVLFSWSFDFSVLLFSFTWHVLLS